MPERAVPIGLPIAVGETSESSEAISASLGQMSASMTGLPSAPVPSGWRVRSVNTVPAMA